MLGLQVEPPRHRVLEPPWCLLQPVDRLAVVHHGKGGIGHPANPLDQTLFDVLVEKGQIVAAPFQDMPAEVAEEFLGQAGIGLQVGKGHLRLDHPELGGMARGVGVLGPEGGAEGVDIAKGQGVQFPFQLSADRQSSGLGKKILAIINRPGLPRRIGQVQGGDPEQFAGPFAIVGGDDRGVDVEEAPFGKELVHCLRQGGTEPKYPAEGVGAGPQMGDGPQVLKGVTLFLQGVALVGRPDDLDVPGLQFHRLPRCRRGGHHTGHPHGAAGAEPAHHAIIGQSRIQHHLQCGLAGTVGQSHETHVLPDPQRTYPASHLSFGPHASVAQQFRNPRSRHHTPLFHTGHCHCSPDTWAPNL